MVVPLEVGVGVPLHLGPAHHQWLHPISEGGLYSKGNVGVKGEMGVYCYFLKSLINSNY